MGVPPSGEHAEAPWPEMVALSPPRHPKAQLVSHAVTYEHLADRWTASGKQVRLRSLRTSCNACLNSGAASRRSAAPPAVNGWWLGWSTCDASRWQYDSSVEFWCRQRRERHGRDKRKCKHVKLHVWIR